MKQGFCSGILRVLYNGFQKGFCSGIIRAPISGCLSGFCSCIISVFCKGSIEVLYNSEAVKHQVEELSGVLGLSGVVELLRFSIYGFVCWLGLGI